MKDVRFEVYTSVIETRGNVVFKALYYVYKPEGHGFQTR
jgi:hypothetical protein